MTERLFRPKSEGELEIQISTTAKLAGVSLVPGSISGDLFNINEDEIKQRFPNRYSNYLSLLRLSRSNGENTQAISISKTPERIQAFLEQCRIAHPFAKAMEDYLSGIHSGRLTSPLYIEQLEAFQRIKDALEDSSIEGYIKLPTGTGKTVLFVETIRSILQATNLKKMIVVPTQLLVEQTEQRFKQFAPEIPIGKLYSLEKDDSKQVTITTYSSLVQRLKQGLIKPENYDYLVLDEAHRSLTSLRSDAVNQFKNAIKLGFTASPIYSEDKQVSNILSKEIYSMGIREAVEAGLLSSFSVFMAETRVDLSKVTINSSGDFNKKDLARAVNINSRNLAAVELYNNLFAGETAIAFCVNVDHASELAKLFNEQNIPAEVISGYQSSTTQQGILTRYKNGETKIICNADLLIEGFDEAKATVCLNLAPTLSLVVAEQRGGRVLRLDPNNPNKHAYIVDFLDFDTDLEEEGNESFGYKRRYLPISFAHVAGSKAINPNVLTNGLDSGGPIPKTMNQVSFMLSISGITVITDAQEVLRIINSGVDFERSLYDSDAWITVPALKKRFGIGSTAIQYFIAQNEKDHPDWFRSIRDTANRHFRFLSLDAVRVLEARYLESVPEGWVTWDELNISIPKREVVLKSEIRQFSVEHPEWFRFYRGNTGRMQQYFSEEFVSLCLSKYCREDWISTSMLLEMFDINEITLKKRVDAFLEDYSETERKKFVLNNVKPKLHSMEIVKYLEENYPKVVLPPDGWISFNEIAKTYHVSYRSIDAFISRHEKERPTWVKLFRGKGSNPGRFLSPEAMGVFLREIGI
jgi:superfamily II DNA or RNA helicase